MVVVNRMRLGHTFVPNVFIDRYIASADGEHVKIYLALLRELDEGGFSVQGLAKSLCISEDAVVRGLAYWEKMGLLALEYEGDKLSRLVMMDIPEGNSEASVRTNEVTEASKSDKHEDNSVKGVDRKVSANASGKSLEALKSGDSGFKQLVFVAEQYLSRTLSKTDLDMLIWIYDNLGFSADLAEYLVEYCVENGHSNVSYIKAVALRWHEQGIKDVESAKKQVKAFADKAKKNFQSPRADLANDSRYSGVMFIYDQRRVEAKKDQEERLAEIYEKIPAYRQMDEEISKKFYDRGVALINGDEEKQKKLERQIEELYEEKECLLVSSGFSKDYDKIHYICPKCQDTGYVDGHKCSCFEDVEKQKVAN